MKASLFRNVQTDPARSMHIYADELSRCLQFNSDVDLKHISINGRRWPIIKDLISKDIRYPLYAKLHQGDVNHVIDHSYGALVYGLDARKTVVTCHDLIPLELPMQSSWLGRKRFLYNIRGMLKASTIIAVSENTKKVLLKHFDYHGNLNVIYQGIRPEIKKSDVSREELKSQWKLKKDWVYLLHVGSSTPTKNTEALLRVLAKFSNSMLLKVGEFNSKQKMLIKQNQLENKIFQIPFLKVEELAQIYNVADLLVFPSFFEGFGLPVAEAMACGCPVVCSNTSSLPEAGGDAAYYIDPYSDQSLQEGIEKVLSDNVLRNDMIQKGLEQSLKFKWESTAQMIVNVYKQILSENKR